MNNTDQLFKSLNQFANYFADNSKYCMQHPAGKTSSFWAEHFAERSNFPTVSEFLSFRRGDFVYGIGDTVPASFEKKKKEFTEICDSIQLFTPLEFIQTLHEPALGAPNVFPIGQTQLSASFVLNAGTTWRIKQLIDAFAPNRKLSIAEVGAGWGACATQLHQILDIGSYTIIDLPENLCLASTYLSMANPDRQVSFVDCSVAEPFQLTSSSLNFALPPAIDRLDGPYDVIINTMSFQEMDLETVEAYLNWARRSLKEDGILISFNSHNKAGITRPSQYCKEGMKLLHMSPFRKVPAGWFNTIPYEMVFSVSREKVVQCSADQVDTIGQLMQLGLDGNLQSFIRDIVSGNSNEVKLGEIADCLFYSDDEKRRRFFEERTGKGNIIIDFLAANYWYCTGKVGEACRLFDICLRAGLEGFAAIRARAMLATIRGSRDDSTLLDDAAGLRSELDNLLAESQISAFRIHNFASIGMSHCTCSVAMDAWSSDPNNSPQICTVW